MEDQLQQLISFRKQSTETIYTALAFLTRDMYIAVPIEMYKKKMEEFRKHTTHCSFDCETLMKQLIRQTGVAIDEVITNLYTDLKEACRRGGNSQQAFDFGLMYENKYFGVIADNMLEILSTALFESSRMVNIVTGRFHQCTAKLDTIIDQLLIEFDPSSAFMNQQDIERRPVVQLHLTRAMNVFESFKFLLRRTIGDLNVISTKLNNETKKLMEMLKKLPTRAINIPEDRFSDFREHIAPPNELLLAQLDEFVARPRIEKTGAKPYIDLSEQASSSGYNPDIESKKKPSILQKRTPRRRSRSDRASQLRQLSGSGSSTASEYGFTLESRSVPVKVSGLAKVSALAKVSRLASVSGLTSVLGITALPAEEFGSGLAPGSPIASGSGLAPVTAIASGSELNDRSRSRSRLKHESKDSSSSESPAL